jgi:hypothetical protein
MFVIVTTEKFHHASMMLTELEYLRLLHLYGTTLAPFFPA